MSKGIVLAALVLAFIQLYLQAAEIPAYSALLLRKMANYEAAKQGELDKQVTASRTKFLKALRAHQEDEQQIGNLDPAIAIMSLVKGYQTADPSTHPELPDDLPDRTKRVVSGQVKAEEKLSAAITAEINQKRKQVIDVLRKKVTAATKAGDLDGAIAIRTEIGLLEERINASAPAARPGVSSRPIGSPRFRKGMLRFEFERRPSQTGSDETGFVAFDELGPAVGKPEVVKSLTSWRYQPAHNAAVVGLLKIEEPGLYSFSSYNYYDRNAIYVQSLDKPLVRYRSGDNAIELDAGMVLFVSVGYVDAKGQNAVTWKPPGSAKLQEIPDELLFHLPDGAKALVEKNAAALAKEAGAPK